MLRSKIYTLKLIAIGRILRTILAAWIDEISSALETAWIMAGDSGSLVSWYVLIRLIKDTVYMWGQTFGRTTKDGNRCDTDDGCSTTFTKVTRGKYVVDIDSFITTILIKIVWIKTSATHGHNSFWRNRRPIPEYRPFPFCLSVNQTFKWEEQIGGFNRHSCYHQIRAMDWLNKIPLRSR